MVLFREYLLSFVPFVAHIRHILDEREVFVYDDETEMFSLER